MPRTIFLLCWLILLTAGCASIPAAGSASAPTSATVGELLAAPPRGPALALGYLLADAEGARLSERLHLGQGPPRPGGEQIWLGSLEPPAGLSEADGARYGAALVRGALEGPGAFGPGGEARFQIVNPQIEILAPHDLSIGLLLRDSAQYEGQAVRLTGQLLASPSSTLLVEQLGPGGVPSADALQLKVARPLDPAELGEAFAAAAGGAARYGPAQIVGLWRGGALYPLAIQAGR